MIQPIYTSVSNADIVSCGKRGSIIKSDPIPLLRDNYLGEYRTELEKAKVRKNLGILDSQVLKWGNISGYIEKQEDLVQYVESKWNYKTELNSDIKNIQQAMDYALYFITNFKGEQDSIIDLQEKVSIINSNIEDINNLINTNSNDIEALNKSLKETNDLISQLNKELQSIDIDASILAWVKAKLTNSKTIVLSDDNTLDVIISSEEENAIQILGESGLYVKDLSKDISQTSQDIQTLKTDIQESLKDYVTKEELGGGDFDFVDQKDFDNYVNQTNDQISDITQELSRTVKTGEDGHVDTLYVNQLSNEDGTIKITSPLEVQTGIPLDIRTVVNSTQDLYNISPETAYKGMTVANIADGNIYMLIDLSNINNKSGWKASYESIQIIACTQEEYELWLENTDINGEIFTPKSEEVPFIHSNTYYYIYENEESQQYYVTKSWMEESLATKANAAEMKSYISQNDSNIQSITENISSLSETVDLNIKDLKTNYYTKEDVYNKEEINTELSNINTNLETNYVTKESLRGDSLEGEDDFVFVTQSKYSEDQEKLSTTLDTLQQEVNDSIKSNSDAQLNSLTVGGDSVVTESTINDLPKHITLTEDSYKELVENNTVDDNTYYYIQQPENDNDGWVTIAYLKANYQNQIDNLVYQISELRSEIEQFKNSSGS